MVEIRQHSSKRKKITYVLKNTRNLCIGYTHVQTKHRERRQEGNILNLRQPATWHDHPTLLSCNHAMEIRQADSDQILSKDQTRKKLHMKRHHTSLFSANSQHKPWEHNFRTILDVTSTGGGNLKTKATLKSE